MVEKIRTILSDSKSARWTALFIVAFTMMMGYFITDVMSPLEVLLTKSTAEGGLGWTSDDYGFFSGSYGYINVFLLMLFFGGIILDKMGIRFTGVMSCGLMVIGVCIKYFGVTHDFEGARFTIDFLNFSRYAVSRFRKSSRNGSQAMSSQVLWVSRWHWPVWAQQEQ